MVEEKKIQLLRLETGLLWPHFQGKKAWSANKLTKFLKAIEYQDIPEHILQAAAERGKIFHQTIQDFFQKGGYPAFVDQPTTLNFSKLEKQIRETINFLKENKSLPASQFLGSEQLYYVFHQEELLATYIDLEFQDYVIELKTNSVKSQGDPLILLIFEIQLLIQHLCTKKDIYLLWSTGQGVVFSKFQPSPNCLKALDILIDLTRNEEVYSPATRQLIIQEITNLYLPKKS